MRRILLSALLAAGLGLPFAAVAQTPDAKPGAAGETPAASLDRLYARLARTRYPEEAQGIIGEIDHLRQQSGSDAADLLFGRALKARASAKLDLSLKLFDAIVDLYPDWSQGWSARATARFQNDDVSGAMADLAQTLKREPRDIGALAGLGAILADSGDAEGSLRAYDRALALAPAYEPLKEARTRAQTKLWSLTP